MNSLFSYENKFMQVLMTLGDLIILNLLFLLCSLPIVTMGAAQAGLYTAVRTITDKNDDTAPVKAFFRGFKSGFIKINLVGVVFLAVIVASLWAFFSLNPGFTKIMALIGFCIVAILETLTMMFHSRFDCTPMQLLRNSALLFLAHPLRVIPATFLSWLSLIIALYDPNSFIAMGPVFLTLFISVTFLLSYALMYKPFKDLVDMTLEKQGLKPDALPEEVEEEPEEA